MPIWASDCIRFGYSGVRECRLQVALKAHCAMDGAAGGEKKAFSEISTFRPTAK